MRKTLQVDFSATEKQVMEFLLERTVEAIMSHENDLRAVLRAYEETWTEHQNEKPLRGWMKRLRMANIRLPLERVLYLQFEALSGMLGKPAPDGEWPHIHKSYTEGDDLLPIWLDMVNLEDRKAGKYATFDKEVENLVKLFRM